MKRNNYFKLSFIAPIFVVLLGCLLTIGSSPLFQTNSWVDSNAMLTMGRAMLHGLVPYKDVIDQRGPVLYAIYAIGAIIKETNFFGVFLIQVVNVLIIYTLSFKIAKDSETNIQPQWIAILGPLSLFITSSMKLGGSPEEFAFTSVLYLLFIVNRYHQDVIDMPLRSFFFIGLNLSLIFWNKYSMIGPFVLFFIWTFCLFMYQKKFQRFIKVFFVSIAGFLSVSLVVLTFFVWQEAIKNLVQIYFVQNLTAYGSTDQSKIMKLWNMFFLVSKEISAHYIVISIILAGWIKMIIQKKKIALEIAMFFFALVFVTMQKKGMDYYNLVWMPFLGVSLIRLVSVRLDIENRDTKYLFLPVYLLISASLLSLPFVNNQSLNQLVLRGEKVSYSNESLNAQSSFGKIMRKTDKKPTLMLINSLDGGFFLATQSLPVTTFFHRLNMNYDQLPTMYKSFNHNMKTKKVDFVIVKLYKAPEKSRQALIKQVNAAIDPHLRATLEANYKVKATAQNSFAESYVLFYKK
ncbi:teichoic acid glycosyl transferase [Dellaglioa sp. L3N]